MALEIQDLAAYRLLYFYSQLQTGLVENVFEKLCCLLRGLTHISLTHENKLTDLTAPDRVASSVFATWLVAPGPCHRPTWSNDLSRTEIGRASCRERV